MYSVGSGEKLMKKGVKKIIILEDDDKSPDKVINFARKAGATSRNGSGKEVFWILKSGRIVGMTENDLRQMKWPQC